MKGERKAEKRRRKEPIRREPGRRGRRAVQTGEVTAVKWDTGGPALPLGRVFPLPTSDTGA